MAADEKRFGGPEEGAEEEDLYAVLGLTRNCSDGELRAAYKKLALRWHPDRCSAKDSKAKFQAIHEAYSVLSDSSQRFLYDFGLYDDDDQIDGDGQYSMCDFLGEMATMMQQNKSNGNAEPSLDELQALFLDMFDGGNGAAAGQTSFVDDRGDALFDAIDGTPTSFVDSGADALFDAVADDDEADFILRFSPQSSVDSCSPPHSFPAHSAAGSKRGAPAGDRVAADVAAGFSDLFDSVAHAFFCGPPASESGSSTTKTAAASASRGCGGTGRRAATKQKVSLGQDVSSAAADGVSAASC